MVRRLHIWLLLLFFCNQGFAQEQIGDQYPDVTYDLVADRMSCIEREIPLNFNEKVFSFVDYFTVRNRDYLKEVIAQKEVFFPIFEELLAKYGLPDELKYLSIVESGLRTNAISRVGAGGLWQFMPATGKSYGLKQSWYIDERMNPWLATEAACKYMKMLYSFFGDWELALAAYNTGPGNVRKAIRRSGGKKTFWEIYRYLPRETRSYVPQFVAVMYALNYADEHNLNDLPKHYQFNYDTLQVDGYVHIETLANQINVCIDDMMKLNPQIIRGATPDGTKKYPVKIPEDVAAFAKANRKSILDSASKVGKKELAYLARNSPGSTYGRTKLVYRVRSGDVLGSIAQRYHVRISDLKKWNRLTSNMIYIGQRLNIWVLPHYNGKNKTTYEAVSIKSTPKPVEDPNGEYYTVRSGDSLWSIANQFENLSIEKLKKLNNLTSNRINPGQRLLIDL